ncbi:selenoprotein M-like isoform X1 [Osmia bicornis bicornis]|uniref:selenoprotein M-like isoform X1 n=1 Tax=Osmia bicornis bicornis TaxID=1437191 RepID=UPI0010F8920E|nr:selenoprotein M-like isoform X1 [Osmia bicornis bicornis]
MASTVAVIFFLAAAFVTSTVDSVSNYYAFARVESCSGCRLNRLPDVKQFIFEDVPNYNNVEFKHIQGAVPELLLFNENDEEVERLPLSSLTREECNNLLVSKGFTKKATKDEI